MSSHGRPRQDPREQAERLMAHGRVEEACAVLKKAIGQAPADWRTHQLLGEASLQDARLQRAIRAFEESLRLNASNPRSLVGLADAYSAAGKRQEAEAAARSARDAAPTFGHAWLRLAHLRRWSDPSEPDLQAMRALVSSGKLGPADSECVQFALGKVCDDLGLRDDAFRHWKAANELHKARAPYDRKRMGQLTETIAAVFEPALFERCRGWGSDSALPVFVVGMPRCGSTLVEQILASHPRGAGAGELRAWPRLVADLPERLHGSVPFPACARELNRHAIKGLATDYLKRLRRDAAPDVERICDKMLSNLLLVGLIAIALPGARVLHCRRNLMDLGLSMYMQSFSGSGAGYAYDLDDIGACHQAFESLMEHWRKNAPIQIVPLHYEEIVSDAERGVRAVIEAAGLPWDERCLQYHASDRQVRTVSDWQVRQPIHNRSVGRWRAYEAWLEPLRKYETTSPGTRCGS